MPTPTEPTKQQAVARRLAERARALGPGARLPTVAALRTELGVSGNTLMHALDDLEAQGILVRKHGVGLFVAPDVHEDHIALICDARFLERGEDASPFWSRLLPLAWTRLRAAGQGLSHHLVVPDESVPPEMVLGSQLSADLRQGRIQGVLGVGLPTCVTLWLQKHRIPLVAFAAYAPHRVVFDQELGARRGIDALVERGARRIALWTREDTGCLIHRTVDAALAAHGLSLDPALVYDAARPGPDTAPARGAAAARIALALAPDAILCTEDTLLRGALPYLTEPRPLIATFANAGSPLLFGYEQSLLRIEFDPAQLVDEMVRLLDAQRAGNAPADACVVLPPILRLNQ